MREIFFLEQFEALAKRSSLRDDLPQSHKIILLRDFFSLFAAVVGIIFMVDHPVFKLDFLIISNDDVMWADAAVHDSIFVQKHQTLH